MTPEQITQITAIVTGGAGATVLLGIIARVLWVQYQETIEEWTADLKAQRDANLEGWKAQIAATERLADAVERMTRLLKPKP